MEEKYPQLIERIQSSVIDTLLIILLMFMFATIFDNFTYVPDWVRIIAFSSLIIYEPLCTSLGFSLGNYIKGIRVRENYDPTKRINFFQAILRYSIKMLFGWISFLTIHSNPKRRAIHDMVSGSVMIKL